MQSTTSNSSSKAGAVTLGVVAFVSISVLAFAPGVGCSSTSAVDSAKQAKERALGRHKFEAISNFIATQRKIARAKEARNAPAAPAVVPTTTQAQVVPPPAAKPTAEATVTLGRKQSAFRIGVILGAWSRFVAKPFTDGRGTMTPAQRKTAILALRGLSAKLQALHGSSETAGLSKLAITSQNFNDAIPPLAAGFKTGTIDGTDFAKANASAQNLRQGAKDAKLKVLVTVPVTFLPKS